MEQVSVVPPGLPAAQRVAAGSGGTRAVMWGGGVPSAVPGAAVVGAGGTGWQGVVLFCCATITATATTPHVAPAAGAAWQGLDAKVSSARGGSSWSLLGVVRSPIMALRRQPGWQHGGCSRGGQLEVWGWFGKETHPMGAAKRGRSEWGRRGAPGVLPAGRGCPHGEAGLPHNVGSSPGTLFAALGEGLAVLVGASGRGAMS